MLIRKLVQVQVLVRVCRICVHLLGRVTCTLIPALLGPARFDGPPSGLAPFLWAHVAPSRGAEAYGRALYGLCSERATGDVEDLEGEVEQHLGRQSALAHDSTQPRRTPDAQHACEVRGEQRVQLYGGFSA